MRKDPTVVNLAHQAWNQLKAWDLALDDRLAFEHIPEGARVVFKDDPLFSPVVDHSAVIHNRAAEIANRHKQYVELGWAPGPHTDAVAAWRLVLRTKDRKEIEKRLIVALAASAKVIAHIADVIRRDANQLREKYRRSDDSNIEAPQSNTAKSAPPTRIAHSGRRLTGR